MLATALAIGALRRRAGPRTGAGAPWRLPGRALTAVRQAHSGQTGDSVTWLTLGTATLGVLFAVLLR